ncbi:MAG: L-histidine N(alpha)-methyltransferase [Desulfobulbaceae bacterium]|nr:L-histidine N(alpha)-methyltransferase [Desulfobulbaceae bacterium]
MQPTTACLDKKVLKAFFNTALADRQNVVLQAAALADPGEEFARSVAKGLASSPRELECRFLYDARGSALYEKICSQPEYYPTRTEESILKKWAANISGLTGPCTLIELGSGSSVKTSHLLSAYQTQYNHVCYTPIDISSSALKDAGRAIAEQHPGVQIVGIHGTYSDSFPLIQCASPALVIFLGSTLGNFTPAEEELFWTDLSAHMRSGDYFLLGVDLLKDPHLLEAAYNDAAGVTAKFTLNYFARMNRELGAGLDLDRLSHQALFNPEKERVEIFTRFDEAQTIRIKPLQKSYAIAGGERILLEISRKFSLAGVKDTLCGYGLHPVRTYTDDRGWFGLILLEKREGANR